MPSPVSPDQKSSPSASSISTAPSGSSDATSAVLHISTPEACCGDPWEEAYARFETPAQEIDKFMRRLDYLGCAQWPREARIIELFCGRGNGLHALQRLGFTTIEGVDLSASLIAQYEGPARCYVCDCRELPFPDGSRDIAIIQGGLHHLPVLPDDLQKTLFEAHRVLRKDGLLVVVEPWLTPFLRIVHGVMNNSLARRYSTKLEALSVMIHHERQTYEQWLGQPDMVLNCFRQQFEVQQCVTRWGKLMFVGRKTA